MEPPRCDRLTFIFRRLRSLFGMALFSGELRQRRYIMVIDLGSKPRRDEALCFNVLFPRGLLRVSFLLSCSATPFGSAEQDCIRKLSGN